MKKKAYLTTSVLFSALFLLTTGFTFNNSTTYAYDPVGVWDYEVTTDEGTLAEAMTITREEGELEVSVETDQFGTLELEDVELEDTSMTANIELDGDLIEFEFEFDGDTMEGVVITPDGDLEITAERRKKK